MNRKHVSKVGKYIGMACLLFVCAMVQSCRDEYYYDDKEPDFLGSSIYGYLEEQGGFDKFLQVIKDLDYDLVLSKTGSKTLFVADDEAFMKGIFEEWGFTDYNQLTKAHKRIILNNAMLDNAYLLEMLSKWPSTDAFAEPTAGRCLRLETSASVTDTIGYFYDEDLPQNNSAWDAFREGGIRLALDATPTTMVFFTGEYLYQSNVTNSDLSSILNNKPTTQSDIYVFDKKVLLDKSNITCKNGYVHQLDGLLIPPSNMAEEIRTNGRTNVFSRMLDRFAVPVPLSKSSEVSETYNRIYHFGEDGEQLYEKRYYTAESERGAQKKDGGFLSYEDVDKVTHDATGSLYFDPGWNAYQAGTSGTPKEQDMAAIFAPTDSALFEYFTNPSSTGSNLVERYAKISPSSISNMTDLMHAIDSIPGDILQALIRNLMQISFKSAVPSKFANILDDARDPIGVTTGNVKQTLIANNGVIYLTDTVFSPARYVAVTAPVMLDDSLLIANRAIDDLDYDKYLLSMGNKFGLIVPTNDAMIFYDPYTAKGTDKRLAYKFVYIAKDDVVKVEKWNAYDPTTGAYGPLKGAKIGDVNDAGKEKLLKEMLEYYIIPADIAADSLTNRMYYMAKGYGTIKVGRDENGHVTALAGGRELQNGTMIPLGREPYFQKNGQTYRLSAGMIHPATQSVYDVLSTTTEFKGFYDLCQPVGMSAFFEYMKKYIKAEYKEDVAIEQFNIFNDKKNIRMFDTYHYTVYVPSNEAMELAHEQGLPTWEALNEERLAIEAIEKDSLPKLANDSVKTVELKAELAQRKKGLKVGTDLILSFVKYHFQDNSVYVDNVPHVLEIEGQAPEYEVVYETAALNAATNKFCSVLVQTDKDPSTGKETISIRGDFGEKKEAVAADCFNVCYVIRDDESVAAEDKKEHLLYNIMTRDIDYNGGEYVYTSSYAVVHQIHGGLGFLVNDVIYDAEKNQFRK